MADGKKDKDGCGLWGCLSTVVVITVLWAIFFGVTIDGKHYGISCSTERGVEFMHAVPAEPGGK